MILEKRHIFEVIHKQKERGMIERRNQLEFPAMEKGHLYLERMVQTSEEETIAYKGLNITLSPQEGYPFLVLASAFLFIRLTELCLFHNCLSLHLSTIPSFLSCLLAYLICGLVLHLLLVSLLN